MSTQFLTAEETADHYRTTVNTLRHWRATGRGPQAVKVGKRLLYPVVSIEAYDRQLAANAA